MSFAEQSESKWFGVVHVWVMRRALLGSMMAISHWLVEGDVRILFSKGCDQVCFKCSLEGCLKAFPLTLSIQSP